VQVDAPILDWLNANPGVEVTIDLEARELGLPDGSSVAFPIELFARYRLLHGIDELDFLLARSGAIEAFERSRVE
jgi:3-isopropylmalate/(R)-2-methylmalate dehydratase small subunit